MLDFQDRALAFVLGLCDTHAVTLKLRDDVGPRVVVKARHAVIPNPKSPLTLACGLHEIGHVTTWSPTVVREHRMECAAWDWGLAQYAASGLEGLNAAQWARAQLEHPDADLDDEAVWADRLALLRLRAAA
jgi:hypothetical protein